MGGMNSMGHGRIPKKEENEGNQQQIDGHDTIYNPPYQHNRSPPYIHFPLSLENGLRKPPKAYQGPEGLVCVCTMQASIACRHVSMYTAGECVRWGLKERKGERRNRRAKEKSVDRSCRSVAGQGLGRSVFVIELETHSHLSSTTPTDKQTNTKISQSSVNELLPNVHVDRTRLVKS